MEDALRWERKLLLKEATDRQEGITIIKAATRTCSSKTGYFFDSTTIPAKTFLHLGHSTNGIRSSSILWVYSSVVTGDYGEVMNIHYVVYVDVCWSDV